MFLMDNSTGKGMRDKGGKGRERERKERGKRKGGRKYIHNQQIHALYGMLLGGKGVASKSLIYQGV